MVYISAVNMSPLLYKSCSMKRGVLLEDSELSWRLAAESKVVPREQGLAWLVQQYTMAESVARGVNDLQVLCIPRKIPWPLSLQLDLTLAAMPTQSSLPSCGIR